MSKILLFVLSLFTASYSFAGSKNLIAGASKVAIEIPAIFFPMKVLKEDIILEFWISFT